MNCQEFQLFLHPYVDGELGVDETVTADAHLAECVHCRGLVEGERQFRQLLRRQPKRAAPPELQARIVARLGRSARVPMLLRWLVAPTLAAVGAALLTALVLSTARRPMPLAEALVDNHIAYAQIEQPAEFASADRLAIEGWFRQRARLHVTVPDFSPSGIRLLGARIAEAHGQRAAYLLYEKGHTLLSVFQVPASGRAPDLRGKRVFYRGHTYLKREWEGYRTVSWTDGERAFMLVSTLDYEAIFECADRLLADRLDQTRLPERG